MYLELQTTERELVAQLVEARIHEMRTEIRRAARRQFRDELEAQHRQLEQILRRLRQSEWDVTA